MSYTALYRKWRPDAFDDVKGQGQIVKTLRNQIESDRVGHAYLFCGTRGTGKTTMAKILAKAVNCESPKAGSPCGECAMCKAIANGSSLNVVEIDAASNNGVDNVRLIKEEIEYGPTEGRYKVYIIDEVHMLSGGAFNALLKTLEEPPSYVIFILATTEVHKIPVTILSRCQRYDFKRIPVEVIEGRLRELVNNEGAAVEERALHLISRMADGAMRDALSLLDQCLSFYNDRELRYEDVLEVVGAVDTEIFSVILRNVINEDVTGIMGNLDEIIMQGRDLTQFIQDFTWYLRNILMLKASPESEKMIDMSAENMERLKEESYMLSEDQIMRYIRILSELMAAIKTALQKRVLIEVAFIKMTRPQMEKDLTSITERLRRLEELVKEKEELLALTAIRPAAPIGALGHEPASPQVTVQKKAELHAVPEDLKMVAVNWHGIIGQCEPLYASYLREARLTVIENRLVMVLENDFIYNFLSKPENFEYIKGRIENTIGKTVELEIRKLEENATFDQSFTDLEKYVNMEIKYE